MKNLDLTTLLRGNPYPGRGIVLGSSPDGEKSVIAYFIMGRSENSRNRVFVETPDGIRTQAFDPSKMTDPSLIIYAPVRVFGTSTIVTNGDQTDTIREGLAAGKTFAQALHTRTFEPDAPNYTPRISGLVKKNGDYTLSILKSADGDPASCHRYFFAYEAPRAGQGHFIHTYMGDGTPLPSFVGEPEQVEIPYGTPAELADLLWDSLNAENKVSLFVRYIDRKTGDWETVIKNKHASA
ncbi:inosine monophosphate cyclohydrolase [Flavonifractor plautii]|uniref:IMP cyclohydrolase n=1 Tax=Flavonifractor plautii TaxID=292800 RepID=A0AAX1KK10_FLAPL|nr:IMP cyclohydrolase [Flavonifractor plautii]ANU42955.1 inosine monophosphate cyclohydrolase [Flavonifractor plautii]OXE45456.1 inosine monophosphate cyclohydrolase [Flavonifractor plautii]QQR06133.1 IMP cyclohydrolase [Flavonifractor plautii]UQA26884.1 IMP cyclohydrolase [Flavonifractor plautii]